MATNSVGQVRVDLTLNKKGFNKDVDKTIKSTENAFNRSFTKIGTVIATAFSVGAVVKFGKSAVNAASEAQAAWTGLNSIVQGTGNSFGVAHEFLTKFTKDGLVGIEDAATAYKNLLARGYDTTQIENVMTRLKDSAAFGRQSSYTLSQAVVSATEGLKNENSILVDNAGVTKNVAKMWEDYAKSINKSTNELTQQEKIQAEVSGIMQETRFQVGDAATYTSTFAGKVSVLKGAFSSMQIAIGKVVAPIVGLFIPAITSAINAITAFFNKLQGVLSVFGLEFPDVVEKTSSGISNIGNSASSAAGNIASTGDAATKAAKKIKKAFAGVDEINVLSSPNKSSDGTDGSSGGSNGGVVNTGNDVISSAIGNTSSKIMEFIKPLQDISFDNLISAFGKLKDALAPLGETIWKGLEWAYFNILVPLAKWTIEDLLPAFLNLLSGALKVLNPILEAFGNIFEPIWNKVLEPIAKWTGGVIVDVMNGVADALSKVGDWMSNNQGVVDTMVASIGTFFGLWKLTELFAFIQMSGGLVAAFDLLTGSIVKNTIAKIADKAETIALTALYAKDFVVSIASGTAALVKQAAQWVITTTATTASTVATTAATAATWLFNAALAVLTSPITLVVAAVAALVAGIVLLIKNWDKVKEVAAKCWDGIKAIWSKVSSWFNTNVIQPISKFFTNLWDGIKKTFSSVASWFKSIFSSAWSGIKGAWSSVSSWFGSVWSNIKSKFSKTATWFKDTFKKAWTNIKSVFSGCWVCSPVIWSSRTKSGSPLPRSPWTTAPTIPPAGPWASVSTPGPVWARATRPMS